MKTIAERQNYMKEIVIDIVHMKENGMNINDIRKELQNCIEDAIQITMNYDFDTSMEVLETVKKVFKMNYDQW